MWKKYLKKIEKEMKEFGETRNKGASQTSIALVQKAYETANGVSLPQDYLELLREVNGIEYNGGIFYGVDEEFLQSEPQQNISGVLDMNLVWHEDDYMTDYIFLGENDISWFVYHPSDGKYYMLDNPSGEIISAYSDTESMLGQLLKDSYEM